VTDECNEEVMLVAAAASGLIQSFGSSRVTLESFPPQANFDTGDIERLKECADWASAVIAIERPGPNYNGEYKTMRGKSMDHLVAPLEDIIGYRMNLPGNIISESDNNIDDDVDENVTFVSKETVLDGDDANQLTTTTTATCHQIINQSFLSIGVGDGGNEVGMGKVYDKILASSTIPLNNEIACVVATTYLLTSSVSNWGGYAIAAALCIHHIRLQLQSPSSSNSNHHHHHHQTIIRDSVARFIVSEDTETNICTTMVEAGARDGVSGQMKVSVDGMDWNISLQVLRDLVSLCTLDSIDWSL